jgi:hypothetical protein
LAPAAHAPEPARHRRCASAAGVQLQLRRLRQRAGLPAAPADSEAYLLAAGRLDVLVLDCSSAPQAQMVVYSPCREGFSPPREHRWIAGVAPILRALSRLSPAATRWCA